MPELEDQEREGSFITGRGRYERKVPPDCETVEVGAGRALKSSCVLASAEGEARERLWV